MSEFADLELTLQRRGGDAYTLDMRFTRPDSDADARLLSDGLVPVHFEVARLHAPGEDIAAYGMQLGTDLFGDPAIYAALQRARAGAAQAGVPLRIRLWIAENAEELQQLHWESLHDPQRGQPLFDSDTLFLRYLSSSDWQSPRLRARDNLRVVLASTAPAGDTAPYEAALAALGSVHQLRQQECSLNALLNALRDGVDVLVLHCMIETDFEPWLWLADEQGDMSRVAGNDLAFRLRELRQRPRLLIISEAGDPAAPLNTGLVFLGRQFAEAGIPALLLLPARLPPDMTESLLSRFLAELSNDGQVDRALAAARVAWPDRLESLLPVVMSRLKSGRIWYVPGFGTERKGFEKWPALLRSLRQGRATPILGSGLLEPLIGSPREIARSWAETYGFPMAIHQRDELHQVAQYVSINQDPQFVRDELAQTLRNALLQRHGDTLDADTRRLDLNSLFRAIGAARNQADPVNPHRVLASQPFSVYITTNPDSLLEDALRAAGKQPTVALCPWNEYVEETQAVYDQDPSVEQPLVYHLFGAFEQPDSLVLTEDDFFNYLIGVTSNRDLIPDVVRRSLADTALLFLGFRLDEWDFRVLFRSFMSQEGRSRRRRYTHVAAQIDPEEGHIHEPRRARRYLENYFEDAAISIYWGSVEDFMSDLAGQLAKH